MKNKQFLYRVFHQGIKSLRWADVFRSREGDLLSSGCLLASSEGLDLGSSPLGVEGVTTVVLGGVVSASVGVAVGTGSMVESGSQLNMTGFVGQYLLRI